MSLSLARANPSIAEPSKPMPSSNAPSSSAGADRDDFSVPRTSVKPEPDEPDLTLFERTKDKLLLAIHALMLMEVD